MVISSSSPVFDGLTTFSLLELGTSSSLSHSSVLPELIEGSPTRSSPVNKPNVLAGLEVEGVSTESSGSRKIDEKYPGPNEDFNCPLPILPAVKVSSGREDDARSLKPGLKVWSIPCETSSCSSSSSSSSISIVSDLWFPLNKSTSHDGEKKSFTVSRTPFLRS